jgi:hypothetical protein
MNESVDHKAIAERMREWRAMPPLHRARAAISELFVDTEHDALALASIAERLLNTQIDIPTLEKIYADEVAPVCDSCAPIGVWPAFDIGWLNEKIERYQSSAWRKAPDFLQSRLRAKRTSSTRAQWNTIREYLNQPKQLTQDIARLRSNVTL